LPSERISRRHAEIKWVGNAAMIHDVGSTNGVFLNHQRVTRAPLLVRDVLRLGDWIGVVATIPKDADTAWDLEEVTKGYWAGPVLRAALEPARRTARSTLPIVVEGETGTGKEGAARAIHEWSGRKGPFLGVNCAALPEALAEGELFGYRKGAFTGADRMSPGYLRAADGGTLFLDEIADLAAPIQAKLLRAIEEGEVQPLGEAKPVRVDLRLVAATQAPLQQAVDEKRFRGDLYARLDGFTLKLPPLRERTGEAPLLFRKLVAQQKGEGDREGADAPRRFDPLLVERLCIHDWPFNVRELTLVARQLLVLHPAATVLECEMLPERLRAPPARARASGATLAGDQHHDQREPDAETFLAALRANSGNVKRTAALIGISRSRAYRLMEQIEEIDLGAIRQKDSG